MNPPENLDKSTSEAENFADMNNFFVTGVVLLIILIAGLILWHQPQAELPNPQKTEFKN